MWHDMIPGTQLMNPLPLPSQPHALAICFTLNSIYSADLTVKKSREINSLSQARIFGNR